MIAIKSRLIAVAASVIMLNITAQAHTHFEPSPHRTLYYQEFIYFNATPISKVLDIISKQWDIAITYKASEFPACGGLTGKIPVNEKITNIVRVLKICYPELNLIFDEKRGILTVLP